MSELPFLSVCIPAYKNAACLLRLLNSISVQTFTDFEVIVTDDSDDDTVAACIKTSKFNFPLKYIKNEIALGSPQNWNAAASHARSNWIKIMHHDDWFSSPFALEQFARAIKRNLHYSFFFCNYVNVYENGKTKKIRPPQKRLRQSILKEPAALLAGNIIGPPSATIYKNDKRIAYDKRLQWLVDIDFYIRYLKNAKPFYINRSLINVGIHPQQVTKSSFLKPGIEIPEHLLVLQKTGISSLKNIFVYDALWRLLRNLQIKTPTQLMAYNKDRAAVPGKLLRIIKHQQKIPAAVLKFGVSSKISMLFSYLLSRARQYFVPNH